MMKISSSLIIGITLLLASTMSFASQVDISQKTVPESVKCLKLELEKNISLEKAYQACSIKK